MLKTLLSFGILFLLITAPEFVSAYLPYYEHYEWKEILFFSLLGSLVIFLIWFVSPLGIIFIFCSLIQFLFPQKKIQIVSWVFQGLVLAFTILLGIAGSVYALHLYGKEKYILLFSILGAESIIFLLMIGIIIIQIIWQRKKQEKKE